ncbi:MAG: hypothetical protein ACRDYW_09440 [Acidimicrobiales bacterium]
MRGLGSSEVEPSAWRAWAIRAGFAKASCDEVPWLVLDLDRAASDRSARRPWLFALQPPAFTAFGALMVLGSRTSFRFSVAGFVGWTIATLAIATIAPDGGFRRRRRSVLRVHGLDDRGLPDPHPHRTAAWPSAMWSLRQASLGVGMIGLVVAGASLLSEPGEVNVLECLRGGGQVAVVVEVTGRGVLADAPTIEWVDPASGAVLASTTLRYDGFHAIHLPIAEPPSANTDAPARVDCRVDG